MSAANRKRHGRGRNNKNKTPKVVGPKKIGYAILTESSVNLVDLDNFLQEFGYICLEAGEVDQEKAVLALNEVLDDVGACRLLPTEQVDTELLKEEWSSFERVGTPSSLTVVELYSPPRQKNAVSTGEVLRLTVNARVA